ncbi:MAG: hypothetical protein ABIG55_00395 [Candidatus Omnitrophota bacterium]|nr:hypothetical protein [Candidatus Omnitrophota bacterium]
MTLRKNMCGVAVITAVIFSLTVFAPADLFGDVNNPGAAEGMIQKLPSSGNISVNFKDVDIKTVLHYLSEISGVDIVPSPGVEGAVTMRLRDKPWVVALDIVTRNYGYVYSRDDEEGIIRVMPKDVLQTEEPVTVVIPLNYMVQEGSSEKDQSIKQLLDAINSVIVSVAGEKATFLASANAIVVTAIPARISSIKDMVGRIDKKTPQIMLEAKVIEVTLDKTDEFGVDWNAVVSAAGARRPVTFPFSNNGIFKWLPGTQREFYPEINRGQADTNFPQVYNSDDDGIDVTAAAVANSIFSYGTLDFSQFTAVLRMLDERDDTEILSSPRVTTLNNQAAVIRVVNNVFLQKSQSTGDTGTLVTVEFESVPRQVGVILEVTPHVNDNNEVTVDLHPQVSSNLAFTELEVSNSQNTVAMQYQSREADTQVMVRDGETIFIGGLISETLSKEDHKFPILGDVLGWIPYVGGLVKYKQDNKEKTEVVFFVTVHIIRDGRDTLNFPGTKAQYDKHYPGQGSAENGAVKKGKIKVSKEKAEVYGRTSSAEGDKKKALFDFRK